MKSILEIKIKHEADDFPDTSYLGEYTDKLDDWVIDRREGEFVFLLNQPEPNCEACGDTTEIYGSPLSCSEHEYNPPPKSREFRFFKPSFNHIPHNPKNWAHVTDLNTLQEIALKYGSFENADIDYARQDFHRMESLNNGNWHFMGIKAQATITIHRVIQNITSSGIWGIESDSDPLYILELEKEELANLLDQLKEIGFSKSQINKARKELL